MMAAKADMAWRLELIRDCAIRLQEQKLQAQEKAQRVRGLAALCLQARTKTGRKRRKRKRN
jgi:hypothetical protein